MSAPPPSEKTPLHLGLYLLGGLCLGAGILSLAWSFGYPGATLNGDFAAVGFNGLDNIQLLDAADLSIPLVVVGVCCLVLANATAWKETGGY